MKLLKILNKEPLKENLRLMKNDSVLAIIDKIFISLTEKGYPNPEILVERILHLLLNISSIMVEITDKNFFRGYTDIMILTYPSTVVPGFDDRLNGANERLWEEGIQTQFINGNMTEEFGYEIVQRLYKNKKLPRAFFCFNDLTAIGVIKGCNALDLKIPDDVAVLGVFLSR